jgi:hypothetical protein
MAALAPLLLLLLLLLLETGRRIAVVSPLI